MRKTGLYGLFFLSGLSALIYELLWQRLLHLVFGVSTLAVSAVLAAFMGGLALGGLCFGRMADRSRRPLRIYALLEAGIGLSALLVAPGFALVTDWYVVLAAHFQPGTWEGALPRLGLALLVLIVPATLIGGTLPFMGRLTLRRSSGMPATFSLLYGVNTCGAVAGAVLTGFVFLHFLGMTQTLWIAVGLNLVVALLAGFGSLKEGGDDLPRATEPDLSVLSLAPSTRHSSGWRGLALGCAGVTGATTLGFEVVWTRILGIFTSNSAYAFALVLSIMLLGLTVGSFLQWAWSRRAGDNWRRLAVCQWLLAGVTLATLPWVRTAPAWLDKLCDGSSIPAIFLGELALTAGVLFLPAILMGLSFPLLLAGVAGDAQRFGRWLGQVYAVNTLGCVAGAFLTGFVLIPWLGIRNALGICLAGNLMVGMIAWGCAARPGLVWRGLAAVTVVLGAVICWQRLPAGGFHKSPLTESNQIVYYREGNNGTVSVVEEGSGRRWLLVDGQPVAGTGRTIVIDQKMLAHLPLLLHPRPKRALTVGFGSGGTSHSMTLHGIDVDCVEIERAVPGAAAHFQSENQGILSHPHFRLIVDDARSWLRVAPLRYDVIATDCTNIQYKSNGDLYTVEYFRLMKDRLTSNGLAAAWVPANGIEPADLKTLLRSFQAVFPHTSVWFMNTLATDFLVVIGTPDELSIDLEHLRARMQSPAVQNDLEAVGFTDPCRLIYTFLASDAELAAYLGAGPLNTDDRPVLSFSTYGATFRSTIAANLVGLLSCRKDVVRYVRRPADGTTMLRHYVASNEALLGHVAIQSGDEPNALRHYVEGAKLLPSDLWLRELVANSYFHLQADPPSQ